MLVFTLIHPSLGHGRGPSREQVTPWPLELFWRKYVIPCSTSSQSELHSSLGKFYTLTFKCGCLIKSFGTFEMTYMFLSRVF